MKVSNITPLIYDLLGSEGKQIQEKKFSDLGIKGEVAFKEIKKCGIDQNFIVLGLMRDGNKAILAPENNLIVNSKDKIIVFG